MSLLQSILSKMARYSTAWILAWALLVGAIVLNMAASGVLVDIYTYFCINLMLVLGLQVFMGNSGILNWTYVGFVGIGAYASSILSTSPAVKEMAVANMYPGLVELQTPIIPALIIGGLVAAAVAAAIAWPLMRLSNAVGVITLFATLIVIHVLMTQWDNVTNGPRTFFGVEYYTTVFIAAGAAAATLLAAYYFRESSLGLRVRASRDDRFAAMAVGVSVIGVRYYTFILSSFVAGLGGGIWAHYITSFSPKSFYMAEAFVLITMLVIGGAGSISGATVGAVIVTVMRESLRQVEGFLNNSGVIDFQVYGLTELTVAILMIVILIWRPEGIIGGQELRLPFAGAKRRAVEGSDETSS